MFKRNTTSDAISQFCHDLDQQNWETVIQIDDVNQAYNSFLDIVKTLFDKNCPVKRITLKNNKYEKPWITPGLKNACKKKNNLCRIPVYNTCTLLENNVKYVDAKLDAPDNAISDNESSSEMLTSQSQISE